MTLSTERDYLSTHRVLRGTRLWLSFGFSGKWTGSHSQKQLEEKLLEKLKWNGEVASLHQVHSASIVPLSKRAGQDADGWLLDRPGILAIIRVADCIPALLYHAASGQAALLHAGRRGIAQGILPKAVSLCAANGALPEEMQLHLGPGIGACCYQVPQQMAQDFERHTGYPCCHHEQHSSHSLLDLKGALCQQAKRAGLSGENLHSDPRCTRCQQNLFYSHRGGDTQLRQYAFALVR